jgi:thiamine-phosphate pyrophosphorylase
MFKSLPRLYCITDPHISGLSHLDQVKLLVDGGATLIQLRDKKAGGAEFYQAACACLKLAHDRGARIIINDRVDVAIAAEADGVHLGQDDLPPEAARRLLGGDKIIGFSTHSLEQAIEGAAMPVDYIAIGPVFGTSTKENPGPVVGLDLVRAVKSSISKPLVAIGGIGLERAREVIEAGADSVAVISGLYSSGDVAQRTRVLLAHLS